MESMGIDYRFTIIGDGSEEEELRAGLAREIESGRVDMTGRLPMEEIHKRMVKHHVLVLTSAYEGLPLALLEGVSHGLVPVISDIPSGHPDVVCDGENGYLIPLGEHRRYAERIAELHADAGLWERLSEAAYENYCREFTVEAMASAMEGIIEGLFEQMRAGTLREEAATPLVNPDRVYAFGDLLLTKAIGGLLVSDGFAKER
jgi:glycosyltransferase involved in cell wall biosynthesis